jgi:hypothetical protein
MSVNLTSSLSERRAEWATMAGDIKYECGVDGTAPVLETVGVLGADERSDVASDNDLGKGDDDEEDDDDVDARDDSEIPDDTLASLVCARASSCIAVRSSTCGGGAKLILWLDASCNSTMSSSASASLAS